MDYPEIKEVIELSNWKEVNRYLSAGWKLLKVYTSSSDTEGPLVNHQHAFYILGCDAKNQVHPEKEKEWDLPGVLHL